MAGRRQKPDGQAVLGVRAPGPGPTWRGALWLALIVTLPLTVLLLAVRAGLTLWPG